VGAFPVHGAAGAYGVLFVGFFAKKGYVTEVYGYGQFTRRYGWVAWQPPLSCVAPFPALLAQPLNRSLAWKVSTLLAHVAPPTLGCALLPCTCRWFYGGHGQVMLSNFVEVIFILCWVGVNMFLLFGLLKITGKLRVSGRLAYKGTGSVGGEEMHSKRGITRGVHALLLHLWA